MKFYKSLCIGILCILCLFTCACGKKYEITENASLIEYGKMNGSSFQYEDDIYYIMPSNVVLAMQDSSKKGKATICLAYYNENGNITSIVPYKTIIFKKNTSYKMVFSKNYKYNSNEKLILDYQEVLLVYEGYNVLYDSSMFDD